MHFQSEDDLWKNDLLSVWTETLSPWGGEDRLTSDGSVSSTRMFGPVVSGPKAQMDLAASRSQSYLVWKNSPSFFLR